MKDVLRLLDAVLQDTRHTLREIRRSPGLTVTIVITLALGVGVNGAMFAVLDRVFWRQPAGVVRPAEVHRVYSYGSISRGPIQYAEQFSIPDLEAMREATRGVADVEGFYRTTLPLVEGGDTLKLRVVRVTSGYFRMLGIRPQAGRFFRDEEMVYGEPRYLVVLSDALWRRRFGADSSVIGRRIPLAGRDTGYTVVGVAEPGFTGVDVDADDMWVPVTARAFVIPGMGDWWTLRGMWAVSLLTRVPTETSTRAAEVRLTTAYRRVHAEEGAWFDKRMLAVTTPLVQARGPTTAGPRAAVVGTRDLALAVRLAGMALAVLVLAAANVAALLLMRALRRRREMAVRVALGISRSRLVSQLVIESIIIMGAAGAAALIVTAWSGGVLRALLFTSVRWPAGVIDARLVAVVALMAAAASAAGALAPMVVIGRRDLTALLKAGGPEAGHPGSRVRSALLVAQTGVCIALLAAAGVFVQSLRRATLLDLGYDPERLVQVSASAFGTNPPGAGFDAAADRLATWPDVVAVSRSLPQGRAIGAGDAPFQLPGQAAIPPAQAPVQALVDAAWFRAMGIRIVEGRPITDEDTDAPFAAVNATMAARFWPGRSALGECFMSWGRGCRRIVGVYADVRRELETQPPPSYVIPAGRTSSEPIRPILVRLSHAATAADVARVRSAVLSLVGATRSRIDVARADAWLEPQLRPWRIAGTLFLMFGLLALASSAAGVYGLVSYDVGRRTREIGIRTTLGATPARVVRDVLAPALRVIAVGILLGLGAAALTGRVMASLLFQTSPTDPAVLGVTAVTLAMIALLAGLVPAWRATRIDPVVALRAE